MVAEAFNTTVLSSAQKNKMSVLSVPSFMGQPWDSTKDISYFSLSRQVYLTKGS